MARIDEAVPRVLFQVEFLRAEVGGFEAHDALVRGELGHFGGIDERSLDELFRDSR